MKKRGTGHLDYFKAKRSQITLFIIAGIIILLIGGTVIYLTTIRVKIPVIPVIEEVPLQISPIRIYTQECISSLAKEALQKLGQQGGYINPEEFGIITSSTNPTEFAGIQFAPGSELKIPYWWYNKAPNNANRVTLASLRPKLKRTTGNRDDNAIESQIDWYIVDNLKACLADFAPFVEQGIVIEETGPISPTTFITDIDVSVYVEYPLKITIANTTTELYQFYASIPLNLKKTYELATELTLAQTNYSFLERHTLNLISSFTDTDRESLPPITESTFEFGGGTIWTVFDVKADIEDMLMTYIPGLQMFDALNYERRMFPGDDIKQATYDQMHLPMNFERKYSDLAVRFNYLGWWPIYFNAGQGGIIQPESFSVLFFGMQRYSTNYDISFPTLITITDPAAFYGEGYSFMFALEANIRNSEAMDITFTGLEGVHTFEPSLFCNLNQRTSGDITVKAIDAMADKKPLEDLQITYTCGPETCFIGSTNEDGTLVAKFPICENGIVSFLNMDYFAPAQFLTTDLDKKASLKVEAYPFIEIPVEIMKQRYSIQEKRLTGSTVDLEQEERAFITLTKIKETDGEADVMVAAEVLGNQTGYSTLRLVPGKYEARIDLFLDKLVIIDDRVCYREKPWKSKTCIPIHIEFNESYPSGGAVLNQETGLVIIGDDLYDAEKITFYAISPIRTGKMIDLDIMGKIEEYSARSDIRPSLEPTFEK